MYDFGTLSPLDFEELVRDLLQIETGIRFESFGPGRDFGIDFRFSMGGAQTIIQAKRYSDMATLLRIAKDESVKVGRINPARYIFATSLSMTPARKQKIQAAFPGINVALSDILGKQDLNNLLRKHPSIERQHFKLWLTSSAVLERILRSGVYNRTLAEMDVIKNLVPRYVYNKSLSDAESILEKHGSLIIAGEPGVGKSTLARMLVWAHAERGWEVFVIDDIKEAFEISADGKKRFVFFDDFLGQIKLSGDSVRNMDQRLPPFFQRVRANKDIRFVLTTRDYILRQAQSQSARLSAPEVSLSEFVLNVGYYTRAVKAHILYNHLYFSDLNPDERDSLLSDDFFLKIIDHRNFNPRLIQLVTSGDYISITGRPLREVVQKVLENPEELWEKPFRAHISEEARGLVIALYFNASRVTMADLESTFRRMIGAMELPVPTFEIPSKFRAAMKELEGSFIAIRDGHVSYGNPGVRDYLRRALTEDRFISTALRAVSKYEEVSEAWSYFSQLDGYAEAEMAKAWSEVAQRLVETGGFTPLQGFELLAKISSSYPTAALLRLILNALEQLREAGIDGAQSGRACDILTQLDFYDLPAGIMDEARNNLCHVLRTMLADYGSALTLDEIKSVIKALHESGHSSQEQTNEAAREALEGYTEDLWDALGEFSSLGELEDFESELVPLMSDLGMSTIGVQSRIDSRREVLYRQHEKDREGYSWKAASEPGAISDDAIRSMFRRLK